MSLTLIDGGLPPRMTYAEWLNAHPEGIHPCLACGHQLHAETCSRDPLRLARVQCPECGLPVGGFVAARPSFDEEADEVIDWKSRGVY